MKKLTAAAIAIAVSLVVLSLALTMGFASAVPCNPGDPGDANGDGDINAGDITKIERIIFVLDAETPGADANGDGFVNAADIGTVEYMMLGIWPWEHVHIEAPDGLPYCTHFTATVFVTFVEGFGTAGMEVTYDPGVLELEGVGGGRLTQIDPGVSADFYDVDIDWSQPGGAGVVVINGSVDGNPGVNGSGYLAELQFRVIGSQGQSTDIGFNESSSGLSDRWGAAIDATWEGDIFTVSAGGPSATATPTPTTTAGVPPDAIDDLAVMSEADGGIEWNRIRLTWTSPDCSGAAVDSYEIRYSSAPIGDGNWSSATLCTSVAYANGGTPRNPGQTETCTVKGLDEYTKYYFAIKSTEGAATSDTSNSVSAMPRQPALKEGDWWMYMVDYDSEDGITNSNYQINNVRDTDQSTVTHWTNSGNCPTNPRTVTHAAVIDWNMVEDCSNARFRKAWAPVVGSATNYHIDIEEFAGANDATTSVRRNTLMKISPNPGFGAYDFPNTVSFYFHANSDSNYDAATIGYPYNASESNFMRRYVWTDSHAWFSRYQHYQHTYTRYVDNFVTVNVSDSSESPQYQGFNRTGGDGVYDVYTLRDDCESNSGGPTCGADVYYNYSPEAHSFVRFYDGNNYFGYEDWVIAAYEANYFDVTDLSLTDTSGNLDVSVNITNTLDETMNFNVLCMLMQTNAAYCSGSGGTSGCSGYPDSRVWWNGQTVYPNVKTTDSGSWPFFDAIQQTGDLAPGETTTVSWTDIYSCGTGQWKVWVAGVESSWTN